MLNIADKFNSNPEELAYDLRQIYARVVGEHLVEVAEARKTYNFYVWFKSLENLKTVVQHKFKNRNKTLERYDEIIKEVKEKANRYRSTWVGNLNNDIEVSEIDASLRKLEEFLYTEMQNAKIFGEGGRLVHF